MRSSPRLTGGGADRAGIAGAIRNPYVGLRSFQESDADVFFGRQRLVKAMLTRLAEPGVHGAACSPSSGRRGAASRASCRRVSCRRFVTAASTVPSNWFVARMTPGDDPFTSCQVGPRGRGSRPVEDFGDRRTRGGDLLARCVAAIAAEWIARYVWSWISSRSFRGIREPTDRVEFIDMITAAVNERTGRSASCSRCAPTSTTARCSTPVRSATSRMPCGGHRTDRRRSVAAIEGPAEIAGLVFEPGLVAHSSATSSGTHRFHCCSTRSPSWAIVVTATGSPRRLRRDGWARRGLAHRAEAVFDESSRPSDRWSGDCSRASSTVGDGTADTRRRVQRRELDGLADSRRRSTTSSSASGRHVC